VGVGAVLRNQIAGIVALLLMLFVIDPTFSALFEGYAPYSIGGLGTAISGGSERTSPAAPTCFRSGSPPCSTRPTRWC
jgi:hypothetical protein